jgi:MOSC domain-containing protein YiiM
VKVISVNVGKPQEHEWRGVQVRTAIFKSAVEGPVAVGKLDLEGDEQGDLTVHGGPDKAVYAYPFEHYAFWQAQLPGYSLAPGNFGENLTVVGLSEESIHIGDQLQIGSARFTVTQPRTPCYKLGVRFDREDMTKRFYASRRFGFYLRVLREGALQAGDAITVVSREPNAVSVADLTRLFTGDTDAQGLQERALKLSALPAGWRSWLEEHMARSRGPD